MSGLEPTGRGPAVRRFSIAPVKGLGLAHPDAIELTPIGVVEDRRFLLIDGGERLIDRLVVGELVRAGAWTDADGRVLRVTLPDGAIVEGEVELGEPIEVALHGRTAVGRIVKGPWGAALSPLAGRPIRLVRTDRPGGTRIANPATLVTEGSLDRLAQHLGLPEVDGRRFRTLIELAGGAAHEEDGWIGWRIGLGEAVLRITGPVPRCAITTQDPDDGGRDLDTLHAIRNYRGLREGKHLDFGVYGEVERPGRIQLSDEVRRLPD